MIGCFLFLDLVIYLRERTREQGWGGRNERQGEGGREPQADTALSMEPDTRLDPMTPRSALSWNQELEALTDYATPYPSIFLLKTRKLNLRKLGAQICDFEGTWIMECASGSPPTPQNEENGPFPDRNTHTYFESKLRCWVKLGMGYKNAHVNLKTQQQDYTGWLEMCIYSTRVSQVVT